MNTFFKKLSFFIAIVAMAWIAMEIFYRTVPNNYTIKDKNIRLNYDSEVLIFGNSHAFYGLNPDYFSRKAFNLSNISQTIFYDKLLFEKHIDSCKGVKYIVLPIEYTTLSHRDDVPELEWRKYFYEAQMGITTGRVSAFDIKKYSLALVPRVQITIKSIEKYWREGTIGECSGKGAGSYIGINALANSETGGKETMYRHEDGLLDFSKNTDRINSIIKKCSEKNIRVLLLNMPVTNYYANVVNPTKRNKIIEQCNALATREGVYYLNLFQDKRFVPADFYDSDHLNTVGEKKCSQIVSDYINHIK